MSSTKLVKAKLENTETPPKKRFSWSAVRYYARTLFKNDACVEVGSKTKWYRTILLFVFALGFAMLPLAINNARTNGSTYVNITGYSDAYSLGLRSYLEDDSASDIVFTNTADGIKATATDLVVADGEVVFAYHRVVNDGSSATTNLLFTIYYTQTVDTAFDTILESIKTYDVEGNTRDSSFVLFGYEDFYAQSFSSAYTDVYSIGGNYKYFYDFIGTSSSFSLKAYLSQTYEDYAAGTTDAIFANFCKIVDNAYITNRNIVVGIYIGISCGVNGGIIVLMGLVYFVMTRGKNSLFKEFKWYQFVGVSMWTSMTPALLSLILGFFFTGGYEIMIFIFAFGFRAMFLSMRQLKPPI